MNINHTNCPHLATRADRAKCRKAKAQEATRTEITLAEVIASYYNNTGDIEEIMSSLLRLGVDVTDYYDGTGEAEEIMGRVSASTPSPAPKAPSKPLPAPIKISRRYREEKGRMRGTDTRKSDTRYSFTRRINGKEFDFLIIRWEGGDQGSTITVREGGTTNILKEFNRTRTETWAHHNRRR